MSDKKALLAVSFGTSHPDALEEDIVPIERALAESFPDRTFRRAFTSSIIIRKLEQRDGVQVDDVTGALEKLAAEGYTDILIQATHIVPGEEYEKLRKQAASMRGLFRRVTLGRPLMDSADDCLALVRAVSAQLPSERPDTVHVFMGHGGDHPGNATYARLRKIFAALGRSDVLLATVEGVPDLDSVIRQMHEKPEVRRAEIRPLLIVAGDHAKHDMAGGSAESWRSRLMAEGYEVNCVLRGLGSYPGVRALFVQHAMSAQTEFSEEDDDR